MKPLTTFFVVSQIQCLTQAFLLSAQIYSHLITILFGTSLPRAFVIHSRRTPLLLRALISILPIFMLGSTPRYRLNNALDGTLLLKVFLLGNGRNWPFLTCILPLAIHVLDTLGCNKSSQLYVSIHADFGLLGTVVLTTPRPVPFFLPQLKQ